MNKVYIESSQLRKVFGYSENYAVFKKTKSGWKMLTRHPQKGIYDRCIFSKKDAKKFLEEIKDGTALSTYYSKGPKHNPNAEYKIGKLMWELT